MRLLLFSYLYIGACYAYIVLPFSALSELARIDTNRLRMDSSPLSHITHFNITRAPSSPESTFIQSYITTHFDQLNAQSKTPWVIEQDSFEEKGLNFTNLILSKSPPEASKYLVLAAHYDTLTNIPGFVGAIDSAVSCSILLDVAEALNPLLDIVFSNEEEDGLDVGLKIVFFDGEEALVRWSADDSIYGARHLHSEWKKSKMLKNIDLFVLLDLLGAKGNGVNYCPSYFHKTHDEYSLLSALETRLAQISGFELRDKYLSQHEDYRREYWGVIEDDHIPFLRSGVPILHLIPNSFPDQWHKDTDDFKLVDQEAVNRWNSLLRVFVAEYLELTN